METRDRIERRSPYILILIFISLTAGIIIAGRFYYQYYKENYRLEVERRLCAIVELKVNELVRWRNERLGDANVFYKNAVFSALVQRFFEKPDDVGAQGQLRIWLSKFQEAYKYDRVMLLDTQYSKKMMVPDGPERITSFVSQSVSEILRSGKVAFEDFYWNEQNQRIYLKVLVPILDEANDSRPIGILALRIDPETYLYPFINQWPIPSRTAEMLIVHREGNEVVFLNELKFQKNTALKLRFPLDKKKELPAVKAALGQEGIVQGIDYRGVPVVADVHKVPDSPWFLVARMDTSEVYEPLKEKLWVTIVLVSILLTGTSAGVGLVWKQQSTRFYRQKYEAAEMLRESEKRYENLFKANIDGILIADATTKKFRYANPAICRMLGYSEEELMRMGVADIHPKESLEQVIAEFEAQLSGAKISADLPCVRKDGQVLSMSINAGKVTIDQTEYLMGIFRDVTESKKADETKERLIAILEATSDFVGFADAKDKHIIYVNKAGRKMCGIGSDEDVTKLKIFDIHPEWTNKLFAEEILPVAVRDGIWKGECAFLDIRDRHEIPVLMVLSSHKTQDGEVEVFSTISRDVTERKKAEEHINKLNHLQTELLKPGTSAEKAKKITDAVVDIFDADFCRIWLTDKGDLCDSGCMHAEITEGPHVCLYRDRCLYLISSSGRYTHIDGKVHRRVPFGCYKIGRVAAEHDRKFLTNDVTHDPRVHNHQWAAELGLVSFAGYQLRPPDGETIGVLALFSKHAISPDEDVLLESIANITAQVTQTLRAEEDLRVANQQLQFEVVERKRAEETLEDSNRQLKEFVYIASHDLREPVRKISSFGGLLANSLKNKVDNDERENLDFMIDGANRMQQMIEALLVYSRVATKGVEFENVDLNEVVEQLRSFELSVKLEEAGGNILVPERLPVVRGDPVQVRQLLQNLVANGLKFHKKGVLPEVTVRAYGEDDGMARIEVQDNGIGIKREQQGNVFIMFKRLVSRTEYEGTGIGLAVCKKIVERHGGKIGIKSAYGEGSTFWFTIPAVEAAVEKQSMLVTNIKT